MHRESKRTYSAPLLWWCVAYKQCATCTHFSCTRHIDQIPSQGLTCPIDHAVTDSGWRVPFIMRLTDVYPLHEAGWCSPLTVTLGHVIAWDSDWLTAFLAMSLLICSPYNNNWRISLTAMVYLTAYTALSCLCFHYSVPFTVTEW